MAPGAKTDLSAVEHTRDYLLAFEEELAKAPNAGALKAAMEALPEPWNGRGSRHRLKSREERDEMRLIAT